MPSKVVPDKFAVMAVDPGGTTGCGTGVFRTDKGDDMLVSVFARAVKKNQISTWEEKGPSELQSRVIVAHWTDFRFRCNTEYGIPLPNIHLVMEDFALRELQAELISVEIKGGVKTLLVGENGTWPLGKLQWQQPSQAKSVKNDRLKRLGIWVVGSEHRRDVMRHIVTFVDTVL